MEKIISRILDKALSARFILAIMGGITFMDLARSKALSIEAVTSILTMIIVFYFRRERGENGK